MSLLPPRMPPRPRSDSQTLYFRAGSSDKEYNLWIEAWADGRYSCHASWGRRGSDRTSQQTADKSGGVSLARAQSVLRELVGEKVAKGYGYSVGAPLVPSAMAQASARAAVDRALLGLLRNAPPTNPFEPPTTTMGACKRCGKNPAGPGRDGYCVKCFGLPTRGQPAVPAPLTPAAIERDRLAQARAAKPKPAPAVDPFAPARRKIVLD